MSKIVGIDLGTTNSLVSTVDSGIPYVIAGIDGRRLTPSVVHFPRNANEVVGNAANRVRAVEPERTFYSVKRFIGRKSNDLTDEETRVNYPLGTLQDGGIGLKSPDRLISPEEVSAEVLKKLRADATLALGEEITRAVITVPAYFNDAQRTATKRAAELAGLVVERMVNEPTAAALAYGLDKLGEKSKIAVYDLGGGTFDLSILELNDGVFQVLSTNGNTLLGGDDIDGALVEFLVTRIEEAQGPDCRSHAGLMARLRDSAEEAKIKLSSDLDTDIALPFLTPEFSFHCNLTRNELEKIAEPIIAKTRVHCLRSIADAKLQSRELDQVILVGGQTRMPLVRAMVKEIFGCVDFESVSGSLRIGSEFHRASGPMLNTSQNPDEAVALGAAIQAEILSGGFKNMLLLDITPLSLGIETFGGLMNVIIPRNSTIPIKAGEVFTTAMDNQPSMLIHVLQGERDRAKDNWSLGRFTIDFERAAKGIPRVGVQFEIDANGILHVLARDIKTGREKIVEMKSAVDVSDADVQKMVEESVEHAFDDLRVRQWTEGKLRAVETATATRKGLAECGAEIDPGVVGEIQKALDDLDKILATEDSVTQAGDARRLKSALSTLDVATGPLAEHMLDKAMEAMLRKRGLIS